MVRLDSKQQSTKPQIPAFRRSVLAMAVMACTSQAFGQEADQTEPLKIDEEIIVTGVRASLESAQDIKRESDTFVDAISAQDMGALPDRSVLEAMQRLPGVSIERFAAPEDPDHFGVEGSGAVIRGMTATRSEFNGRDSFTANSGRGLSFQDVPPELMAGVDLYKNQTADMIEGGIGGTVSLRTRKPFDQPDRIFAISGDVSYGDMAKEWSPTISALFSDRWDTGLGEFGLLLNIADSTLYGESHGIQSDAYVTYNAAVIPGAEEFALPEGEIWRRGNPVGEGSVWIPNGSNFFTKRDHRERKGYAGALQWGSPDETMTATLQAMRSDATLSWTENALKYQGGYENQRARPYGDTEFTFNEQGVFQSGFITDTGDGWRGGNNAGSEEIRVLSGENTYFGNKFQADTRYQDTNTVIDDIGFNFNWAPSSDWEFEVDLQYIHAETKQDDLQIALGVYALQDYDASGDTPRLRILDPWDDGQREAIDDYMPGYTDDPAGDANYFQDIHNYWLRSAMDHYERSDGDSVAGRFDVTRYIDDVPFLRAVKAGVRYAEREQTVRRTSYGWGHLGAEWAPGGGEGALWLDQVPELANYIEYRDWSNFHRGGVATVPGGGFIFPSEKLMKRALNGYDLPQNNPDGEGIFEPYPSRDGRVGDSIFTPDEIYGTTEENNAAYVRLDFGSDDTALRFSGNIGLRYVEMTREAMGSVRFPELEPTEFPEGAPTDLTDRQAIYEWADRNTPPVNAGDNDPATPENLAERGELMGELMEYARNTANWLSDEDLAFGNHAFELDTKNHEYRTVLPSLNVKVELTDDLIARGAVSKAIAWPDMSEVRNQAILGMRQLDVQRAAPIEGYEYVDGQDVTSVSAPQWEGSGGNPSLDPMESIQYDLSLEWYFAEVGSLTGSLFYKDLTNFFISGAFPETYTNTSTGVTRTVDVEGTRNGGDGTMQGFEVAYQQFYDMLPEPFDGLGLQLNYTWIESEGVPNFSSDADPHREEEEPDPAEINDALDSYDGLPLRGQSEDTFNIVGMYEKAGWSLRLAYNWRSRYLMTTRDVISKHPIWNDDAGFLDGSIFYDVTDDIQVGMQFTNLLDTQTKTIMILDNEGREADRSWFVNDRRAAFVFRANF